MGARIFLSDSLGTKDVNDSVACLAPIVSRVSVGRMGHAPSTAGTFRKKFRQKFRKDPGNALRAFPGIPLESTAGTPQAL